MQIIIIIIFGFLKKWIETIVGYSETKAMLEGTSHETRDDSRTMLALPSLWHPIACNSHTANKTEMAKAKILESERIEERISYLYEVTGGI